MDLLKAALSPSFKPYFLILFLNITEVKYICWGVDLMIKLYELLRSGVEEREKILNASASESFWIQYLTG
jgi:hypothetical protein